MKIIPFICSILLFSMIFGVPHINAGGSELEQATTYTKFVNESTKGIEKEPSFSDAVYKPTEPSQRNGFLSDVLAFQTALLALLIPLSFDVISRISDRYKSEIIIKRFQREPIFLSLTGTLIINITYMLFLRFFENNTQVFSEFSLFLALLSIIFLSLFLLLVSNYTNISYIKKKLLRSASNVIK